jgi:preprotein translocase subunit Sss1
MIHSFIAHTSPGRSRVFALARRPGDELEAVTTLGAGDLHLTKELVSALNAFLYDRDDRALEKVLDRAPKPVRMAAQQYLRDKCEPVMGAFTECGPVEVVREAVFFGGIDPELEEYLECAYTIGLGIRMSNERRHDGGVGWVIRLLNDEVSVPASSEPRTWGVPAGAKLARTWTSMRQAGDAGPVRGALQVAADATATGRWVRIHTLLHSRYDIDFEGSGTSEFIVDVFDAPIPLSQRED